MFHDIPQPILERMHYLEKVDTRDRTDGTARLDRLRQIPPETGRFIALLAASAPEGTWIEIGTSGGYSALWLSLAAKAMGNKLITYEVDPQKVEIACETFSMAGVEELIELVRGDALDYVHELTDISFCFLDAEKDLYHYCYSMVVKNMVKGGLLVADNVISHAAELQPLIDKTLSDERVDALVVPIGKGELVCRRV